MKKNILLIFVVFMMYFFASPAFAGETKTIKIRVDSNRIEVIAALPTEEKGADISGKPTFHAFTGKTKNKKLSLDISSEPVWIKIGGSSKSGKLSSEQSPFGFLPAGVDDTDYSYALDIGVTWERGGIFPFFWSVVQADPETPVYEWQAYDRYFQNVPQQLHLLKNISVTRFPKAGMPRRLGAPGNFRGGQPMDGGGGRRPPNFRSSRRRPAGAGGSQFKRPDSNMQASQNSQFNAAHVDGETYRPSNIDMYKKWVKATVERYDGDGNADMPGLKTPVKHWQIDNEPENERQGFGDLVHITSQSIKAADPHAKVLMGGLFLPLPHAKMRYERSQYSLLKELKSDDIDIVDVHWFGGVGEWKAFSESIQRIRSDLRKHGLNDKPIWITELGTYSGQPRQRGGIPIKYQSERAQAVEMLKRYVVALNEGVEKIFWAWGMMEGFGNPNDNDVYDNTGFIYNGIGDSDPGKGTKKIVYWAYQKMTGLMQYWDGQPPEKIDVSKEVHAYRFNSRKGDGSGVMIVWLDT